MNRTQKKHLFLLGGIVAALVIILAVVLAVKRSNAQQAAEEAARQEAESVITQTEASYTALTYDNGTTTLSFHLDEEGKWVWSDDPEFPLDDTTVQSILDLLADLRPQQTITEGDTLEAYGLDQPFATLTATKPDGGTLTISLGDQSIEAALPEGVQAETLEHLWTGAFVSWQAEDGTLRLVDQAALPPESSTAISTVYLAALSARVSFSDGQFALSDFTLQSKLS